MNVNENIIHSKNLIRRRKGRRTIRDIALETRAKCNKYLRMRKSVEDVSQQTSSNGGCHEKVNGRYQFEIYNTGIGDSEKDMAAGRPCSKTEGRRMDIRSH